jgi:mono/diheme cytochrome c family protein
MNGISAKQTLVAVALLAAATTFSLFGRPPSAPAQSRTDLARGRYLVLITGCNDCHTPQWSELDGNLPQSAWLTGSTTGFRSASGTSYPTNLRLEFATMAEDEWDRAVQTRAGHPPMVWQNIRNLSAADRHAIYVFIRSLGPAGKQVPPDLPPWENPKTPYVDLRAHGQPS